MKEAQIGFENIRFHVIFPVRTAIKQSDLDHLGQKKRKEIRATWAILHIHLERR